MQEDLMRVFSAKDVDMDIANFAGVNPNDQPVLGVAERTYNWPTVEENIGASASQQTPPSEFDSAVAEVQQHVMPTAQPKSDRYVQPAVTFVDLVSPRYGWWCPKPNDAHHKAKVLLLLPWLCKRYTTLSARRRVEIKNAPTITSPERVCEPSLLRDLKQRCWLPTTDGWQKPVQSFILTSEVFEIYGKDVPYVVEEVKAAMSNQLVVLLGI
jgi:hypothetical protein